MKLSILIATITERKKQFDSLILFLQLQHQFVQTESQAETFVKNVDGSHLLKCSLSRWTSEDVEIMAFSDSKEASIGTKRQGLIANATGDYIVFIDDDDTVASDYIPQILAAIEHGKEAIGFLIDCDMEGTPKKAIASIKYPEWKEKVDGYDYVRSIYHKTPVRRELALKAGFNVSMRFGEDHDYAMRLKRYLTSEYFINKTMYYYQYHKNGQSHNERYGIK